MKNSIAAAVSVLESGSEALHKLAAHLKTDKAFPQAVELVLRNTGRVIVTGVGKSGHIGGKIAATLASTGTPAFFVHPTEALHGDLGMITREDIILALSHSGESKELAPILAYAARFTIPVIGLTGKASSTLGKASSIVLNTRVEKEACPLNLAPTTSTTAALALADALAVALMTARGFAKTDFAVFHPGGKLGAQLLRVHEVMTTKNLPLLPQTATVSETLVKLTETNLGCVGFINPKGELIGIFTDGDFKRQLTRQNPATFLTRSAAEVMTPNPKSTTENLMATAAVAQMSEQNVSALWVLKNEKPVGLIRLADCLRLGVI